MTALRWISLFIVLGLASSLSAQTTNQIAAGNTRFSAHDIDANDDQTITREEMMQFAEKMWAAMSGGHETITVADAASDFASGGINFGARAMDSDHDGTISHAEFLAYAGRRFDRLPKTGQGVSVQDVAKALVRSSARAAKKAPGPTTSPAK